MASFTSQLPASPSKASAPCTPDRGSTRPHSALFNISTYEAHVHYCRDWPCKLEGKHVLSPMPLWSPMKPQLPVTPIKRRKFDFTLPPDSVEARANYEFLSFMHPYEGDYESARRQQKQDELDASLFGTNAAPSTSKSILSSQVIPAPEQDPEAPCAEPSPALEVDSTEPGSSVSGDEVGEVEGTAVLPVGGASDDSTESSSDEEDQEAGADCLPFPTDQATLVQYLEDGLSVRNLFPKRGSQRAGGITCQAKLKMMDGKWFATRPCREFILNDECYQRHIKSAHLGFSTRGSLQALVNSWNYDVTIPKHPTMSLRIAKWNGATDAFPELPKAPSRKRKHED